MRGSPCLHGRGWLVMEFAIGHPGGSMSHRGRSAIRPLIRGIGFAKLPPAVYSVSFVNSLSCGSLLSRKVLAEPDMSNDCVIVNGWILKKSDLEDVLQ